MDIKSNKYTAKSGQDRQSVSDKIRLRNSRSISPNKELPKLEFKEGQFVKGEIIDRRYNEVSLQVEPSKQVITANLSGDIPLSIGQEAQFQVTENSTDHLTLKYVPTEESVTPNPTIDKALAASGLPSTDRNKAIVEELLNNKMPIDRQTIQNLVRLSHTNREASPLTLVLMYKNNLPITADNIRQYEAYQNGNGKLLENLKTITGNITELLKSMESASDLRLLNNNLLTILNLRNSNTDSSRTPLTLNSDISNILNPEKLNQLSNELEKRINTSSILTTDQRDALLKLWNNGSVSLDQAFKLITYGSQNTEATKSTVSNLIKNSLPEDVLHLIEQSDDSEAVKQQAMDRLPLNSSSISSDYIDLLRQYSYQQHNNSQLGQVLTPDERTSFIKLLEPFSLPKELSGKIMDGSATLTELLDFLQEKSSGAEENLTKNILQSTPYLKIIDEIFHQKWTITPEKMAQKVSVVNYFEDLKQDLDKLSSLLRQSNGTFDTTSLQEPVKEVQDNLNFLKDLNEIFTYLQLPIQFKNQDVHSELYVLTRKNASNSNSKNLSILLHLDMANLGPLNIHIQSNPSFIQANFYLENKEARQLIGGQLPSLVSALQKKGYDLHADVKDNYKKPDFSKDFLEESSQENYIKRYTFDIRT